jgi:hypothetical protein
MPRNIFLALLSIAIAACAGYMNNPKETDLVLVCPVTITQGTSEITVKRRYEINYDTRKVAEDIDQGSGWTREATLDLQAADHDMLVFSGGGIQASYIDQHSGEYRQVDDRGKAIGTCEKTAGTRLQRF